MRAARAWHALTAAVTAVALVLQLILVIEGGRVLEESHPPSMWLRLLRFASYFTVQSNVLVLVSTAVLARDPLRAEGAFRVVRTAAMTGIIVTGLVHWFLLRPLLHLAVPVLASVGWLVFGPRPAMTWPTSRAATVWPLAWLVVILVQGALTGWYPYPFLDHREHDWPHVVVVCAGIFVLWFALLFALQAYDRRMAPAPPASAPATGS